MITRSGLKTRKIWLLAAILTVMFGAFLSLGLRTTHAGSVEIRDDAGILDSSAENSLKSKASGYPFNVRIYTTNSYTDRTQFINQVRNSVPSNGVVYGVSNNPSLRSTYVAAASSTGIDSGEADAIATQANSFFSSGNFGGGFDAMLNSSAQYASVRSGSTSSASRSSGGSGIGSIVGCLVIGLIALVALSFFGFGRRRQMVNNNMGGPGLGGGYGQGYGSGYAPGYGGPGYGQGYGPGYNQGGGMGALGGGAIGAGLGGLVGYELGRNSAQNQNPGNYSDPNAGGVNGGGSDWGNSGGGSGSDWGNSGGGGSDFGSSSSFDAGGGGGGGDFGGGGGDFGGGGGGGDSGGSSW